MITMLLTYNDNNAVIIMITMLLSDSDNNMVGICWLPRVYSSGWSEIYCAINHSQQKITYI